jgi:hypothetical protein
MVLDDDDSARLQGGATGFHYAKEFGRYGSRRLVTHSE